MFLLLEKAPAGAVFKLEDILPSIPWGPDGLIAVVLSNTTQEKY